MPFTSATTVCLHPSQQPTLFTCSPPLSLQALWAAVLGFLIFCHLPLPVQAQPTIPVKLPQVSIERLTLSEEQVVQPEILLQVSLRNRENRTVTVWVSAQLQPQQDYGNGQTLRNHWREIQLEPLLRQKVFLHLPTPQQSGAWQVEVNMFDAQRKNSLLSAGVNYIIPIVVSPHGIEDISQAMTLAESQLFPKIRTDAELPDLVLEKIEVAPTSQSDGFRLRVLLSNQGGRPVQQILLHGLYANAESPKSIKTLKDFIRIRQLSAGENIWVEINANLPESAGTVFRLGLRVDPDNLIPESDEQNNELLVARP